jgi:hypothetical protein
MLKQSKAMRLESISMPRKEKAPVIQVTPEVETPQVNAEKAPKTPKVRVPKVPKPEKPEKTPKEKAPKAEKPEKAPKAEKPEKPEKVPKVRASKPVEESQNTHVAQPDAHHTQVEPQATQVDAQKEKKKRQTKRQPKDIQVVAIVTPDGIEGTFTPEARRPLIVHFPFNSAEVSFTDVTLQYDPNPPPQVQPYDGDQNYFQVNSEGSSDEIQIGVELVGWKMSLEEQMKKGDFSLGTVPLGTVPLATVPSTSQSPNAAIPGLIKEEKKSSYLQEKVEKVVLLECYSVKTGETFKPPAHTDVHCFWCTHGFEESPFFLPVKEECNVYHVYGNFCTAQCALAYLLYEHMDSHVRWERMALLHRMYRCVGRLYPAPPRDSLTTYGGKYTIDKFREIISENRVRVDVQVPPMVSILGTLDTKPIDFYDSSLQNTFTQGFSMDRFKAWSEQGGALRLKRSKPLKDHDSTLDACINISVKRGGE